MPVILATHEEEIKRTKNSKLAIAKCSQDPISPMAMNLSSQLHMEAQIGGSRYRVAQA
jgi:hypothetical protein